MDDYLMTSREVQHVIDVMSHLTDDLRRSEYRKDPNQLRGHCYVASETLHHLIPGTKPMFMHWEDEPHWFLDYRGVPLDVTAAQFETQPDYSLARGKGFLTKLPSKRSQILLARILGQRP